MSANAYQELYGSTPAPSPLRHRPRPARTARRALLFAAVFAAGYASHGWSRSTSAEPEAIHQLAPPIPVRLHHLNAPEKNDRRPLFSPQDCPLTVIFTDDEYAADCLIMDSDQFSTERLVDRESQRRVRPWQSQAILAWESAPNRPLLEEHHRLIAGGRQNETFDFELGYRLTSDVPQVYAYSYMQFERPPVPWEHKRQDKLASAFMSNCEAKNARNIVLEELIRLLPGQIDSFGACSHNADVVEELQHTGLWDGMEKTDWNIKVAATSAYKFAFAMENSNEVDYVTEKYFQALEHGSVPLVLGAPNFEGFLPTPNAAINIADYLPSSYSAPSSSNSSAPTELTAEAKEGLARLAERLRYLGSEQGRTEYEEALAWKLDDAWTTSPLGKVVGLGRERWSTECRLAGLLRGEEWAKPSWVPHRDGRN